MSAVKNLTDDWTFTPMTDGGLIIVAPPEPMPADAPPGSIPGAHCIRLSPERVAEIFGAAKPIPLI